MRKIYFTIVILLFTFCSFAQFTNIRISNSIYRQTEPIITVNPLNQNILLAAWNDWRPIENNIYSKPGYAFSTNSGQSWIDAIELPPGFTNGYDPSVAFDKYGNAFYCYIAAQQPYALGRVFVSKTTNFGDPWIRIPISSSSENQDKCWLTVDNTGGEYDGRLYVAWTDFQTGSKIKFSYSTDHGSNFTQEITLAQTTEFLGPWTFYDLNRMEEVEPSVLGAIPVIAANGDIYVTWIYGDPSKCEGTIYIRRSTDGGNTFGQLLTVTDLNFVTPL